MRKRFLLAAPLLLAAGARAQPAPAQRVRAMMTGELETLGVDRDASARVFNAAFPVPEPIAESDEDAAAEPGADPDKPLDGNDAPYRIKKNGTVTDCKTVAGPKRWKYCVTVTEGSSNHTILYFLHGHGHNAEGWINSGDYKKRVREDWKAAGIQPPIVVTVSFGGFWLLVEKNSSERSGLLEYFTDSMMPLIEKDLPKDGSPRRRLMGESMGGFNAAQVVLRDPRSFERAVLACPAVAHISPFATPEQIAAYKNAPGVSPFKVWLMLHLSHKLFKTEADWAQSDPFVLGQTRFSPSTPKLLISAGDRDSYGLYRSIGEFASLARERGVDVAFNDLHGGHCSADPAAIARFLAP